MRPEVEFYLEDLKTKFAKINPKEYYLSYSGGKDSHFLLWFIKEYAHIEGIEVVSLNTGMEHPEIFKRMKANADRILTPAKKPMDIKRENGIPCFSKLQDEFIKRYQNGCRTESIINRIHARNSDGSKSMFGLNGTARSLLLSGELHKVSGDCCKYLKKIPARKYEKESGKKAIMGVRGAEGLLRKSQYTSCFTKDLKFTPLHDLTDEWLDWIYEEFNIEIPEIYNHVKRTGCMGCPYGFRQGDTVKELDLLPSFKRKFVVDYFKETYEVLGIDTNEQMKIDFKEKY